jgi:hypothetical protein
MAHTAPAAAFILHLARIGKGVMKIFGIVSQWRGELFLIAIFHLSIRKAAMNAPRLWKLCKGYLTRIDWGATMFLAAFPVVNEILWRTVDF